MKSVDLKKFIQSAAAGLGFSACGFARAEDLVDDNDRFSLWIQRGRHASMSYLARTIDIRRNPSHEDFFPGGKTVIMFASGYFHEPPPKNSFAAAIAAYARGRDYHDVIRAKLKKLVEDIRREAGDFNARIFIDSAPVMEKAWAARSGVGWIGKNSLVLSGTYGSYVVLGGMVTDAQLEPDPPAEDGCGSCRACLDACPTGAINADRTIDAGLCISYYTTEVKTVEDEKLSQFVSAGSCFGCDICQQVCPCNEKVPEGEGRFRPLEVFRELNLPDLMKMKPHQVRAIVKDTTLYRLGAERLLQNVRCCLEV